MKSLAYIFLFLVSFTYSLPTWSAENHILVGFAPNYSGVDTARLGIGNWEYGMLSQGFYGAARIYPIAGSYYMGLGLGLYGTTFGFEASTGFRWDMIWGLWLRGGFAVYTNGRGETNGRGTMGLEYRF